MSPRITKKTTRRELAAIVARALAEAGIDAILVGGAVAALYSKGRYLTDDLDFVSYKPLKLIAPVMQQLGFKMVGNKATHHAADLYVQFCAPPVTVGHAPVTPVRLKTRLGTLELLSPTDCVGPRSELGNGSSAPVYEFGGARHASIHPVCDGSGAVEVDPEVTAHAASR